MAAEALANTLLTKITEDAHHSSAKVTVVGTGQVGMAAAFAMMTQVDYASKCLMLLYDTSLINVHNARRPTVERDHPSDPLVPGFEHNTRSDLLYFAVVCCHATLGCVYMIM